MHTRRGEICGSAHLHRMAIEASATSIRIYLLIYLLTRCMVLFYYAEINGAQSAIQNARLNLLLLYCALKATDRHIHPYAKTLASLIILHCGAQKAHTQTNICL